MSDIPLWKWILGTPATFATRREKLWKEILSDAIPPSPSLSVQGISLKFELTGEAGGERKVDIDNLCEPIFAVLVGRKGWFSRRRPNIEWYSVSKTYVTSAEAISGCQISVYASLPTIATVQRTGALFSAIYEGVLPRSARDEPFANWVRQHATAHSQASRFSVGLRFGGSAINIGDIATGRVKSVIDCLYPILGGVVGAPEDWRITSLYVEKNSLDVPDGAVSITIGHGPEAKFELREGDELLGILESYDSDFPWIYCDFEPTPTFAKYEPLFRAYLRCLGAHDYKKFGECYGPIDQLGLRLVNSGREAKKFLLHIDIEAKKANFRGRFFPIGRNGDDNS